MQVTWANSRASRRPIAGAVVASAAAAFHGGPAESSVGVVFCHGFTGSPASMRPWAEAVAAAGFAVTLPRLPGHGTSWQEMTRTEWTDWYAAVERAHADLAGRCDRVAVAGLSMGGALALRLAEREPLAGVVLVNPAINNTDPAFRALGVLKHLTASIASIGGDIALPGQDEVSYNRTPLAPAHSMAALWRDVRAHLGEVTAPVLMFTSRTDHVVDPSSARLIEAGVPRVERRVLEHSFHVATIDHDAERIAHESIEFLRGLA